MTDALPPKEPNADADNRLVQYYGLTAQQAVREAEKGLSDE